MATIKKEYPNDDLTIVWQPAKCIHAGICVKTLPEVYDPKAKPWIKVGNATTEEIIAQVKQCPSGALSYFMNNNTDNNKGEKYELTDNREAKQYQFSIDGKFPCIEYIRAQDKIFLTHTEVPTSLEGQGIGSALIKKVLEDIDKKELTLVPLCPFVASYIKRHPEWKRLVLKGINIA